MTNEVYEPSPSEIAAACAEIRSTWTAAERMTRLEKTPPRIPCDFIGIEAAAAVRLEDRLAFDRESAAAMKA